MYVFHTLYSLIYHFTTSVTTCIHLSRYCAVLGKSYLSLLVLHYIIRWFCPYLTIPQSFGKVVVRVVNPT